MSECSLSARFLNTDRFIYYWNHNWSLLPKACWKGSLRTAYTQEGPTRQIPEYTPLCSATGQRLPAARARSWLVRRLCAWRGAQILLHGWAAKPAGLKADSRFLREKLFFFFSVSSKTKHLYPTAEELGSAYRRGAEKNRRDQRSLKVNTFLKSRKQGWEHTNGDRTPKNQPVPEIRRKYKFSTKIIRK